MSAEAGALAAASRRAGWTSVAADLLSLTKPRITLMVLVTSAAGYLLGARSTAGAPGLLEALIGIALVCGGTSALNQVLERDVDARMARTRRRPLPDGRLSPAVAMAFSLALAAGGVLYLAVAVNLLTAALGALALIVYDFAYTPLKRVGSLAILVGAVPGALPAVGGWSAATGELGPGAITLFAILFLWQLPHFLALGWLYREDYRRAGLRTLSVADPCGARTGRQAVSYSLALLPVSLIPAVLGLGGAVYALGAVALGTAYLTSALRFALQADVRRARGLFRASLVYLPALLLLLTFDPGAGSAVAASVAGAGELLACPGCIQGSSPELSQGFFWGMVLLMAAPAFLLVVIGGGLVHTYRRAMREEVERLLEEAVGETGRALRAREDAP
ncbi:MAG: heme o synthase [Gemmatimonadota bacterium]